MDPNNIEERSKEVREIMDNKPVWIIRWGIVLIIFVFTVFLIGSFLYKYSVIVSVPVVLEMKHDTLVPLEDTQRDAIIGHAFLSPSDAGKVKAGQMVNIKLTAFPYMEYGVVKGLIKTVSKTKEMRGYQVSIELPQGMVSSHGKRIELFERMDGSAEIITDKVRLIYQLIPPVGKFINPE